MRGRALAIVLFALAALAGSPRTSSASTITLDASLRGWYLDNGYALAGKANQNYVAGDLYNREHRNWFTFDLSGVAGTVVAATLLLDNPIVSDQGAAPGYASADPSETYSVFDVSAANTASLGLGSSVPIFTDLGSGTHYGSVTATAASNGTTVAIALNTDALASINAVLGGTIAFGGAITTLDGNLSTEERLFAWTHGQGTVPSSTNSASRLQLTTAAVASAPVPEPASLLLLGTGLAVAIRRRRKSAAE